MFDNIIWKVETLVGFGRAIIGGSYVVEPLHANDIDVCVHEYHAGALVQQWSKHGFRELRAGDKKYDEIDHQRLINVYEGMSNIPKGDGTNWKINIIVVGAVFWPAYIGSINEMRNNPQLYMTREARVELHRDLSRKVAKIAGVELIDGSEQ